MTKIVASNQFDENGGQGTAVVSRDETEIAHPKMFKVLLHNDDFTPMDFVVHILQRFFRKSAADAEKIMLDVHKKGVGVCGVYTFEVAETKAAQVSNLAQQHEYPLKCTIEEETD